MPILRSQRPPADQARAWRPRRSAGSSDVARFAIDIVLDGLDLGIGGVTDMSENANRRTKSSQSTSGLDGLIEAARAVVTAHSLRDDDVGSDDDVSDAIANLGRLLP